jgi:polyadenylate-binding protein
MSTNPILNSTSLYVGDLASDISESHLYSIFSQVGLVSSIRVCRDALTRRSLGYAYVNYHNTIDATEALERFNNHTISPGRPCRIMYSQRDPSIRKSGIGNIFIKNLNKKIDHKSLFDTFITFGNILSCKISSDENGNSKGYGFVQFETQDMADRAIEKVNGMLLMSKQVFVGKFIPKRERIKSRDTQDFTNVFVKNLPETTDEQSLKELFSEFGQITSSAINSHDKTKFAFVAFSNPAEAKRAVSEMNGKTIGGLQIYAGRAQKKAERQAELRYKFQNELATKYQGVNLYIKNLSDDVTDARLKQEFSQFGSITSAEIMKDDKGNSKGFGFVCFSTPEEANRALEMNNQMWDSKPIYVALAQRKEVRRAQLQARYKGSHAGYSSAPFYSGGASGGAAGGHVYYQPQSNALAPQPYIYNHPAAHAPRGGRGGWVGNQYNYNLVSNAPRGGRQHRGSGGRDYNSQRGGRYRGGAPRNEVQHQENQRNAQQAPAQAAPQTQTPPQAQTPAENSNSQLGINSSKDDIGEALFPLIQKTIENKLPAGDEELPGKITGMFLENHSNEELIQLINNSSSLDEKVVEALTVLEQHNAPQ